MSKFTFYFIGRERGAIGIFYKASYKVEAYSLRQAQDLLMNEWEINNIHSFTRESI